MTLSYLFLLHCSNGLAALDSDQAAFSADEENVCYSLGDYLATGARCLYIWDQCSVQHNARLQCNLIILRNGHVRIAYPDIAVSVDVHIYVCTRPKSEV